MVAADSLAEAMVNTGALVVVVVVVVWDVVAAIVELANNGRVERR